MRAMPKSVSLATPAPSSAVGDHDVAGLDVAVDDAARVRVGQRVAQRDADPQHVAVGQRAVGQRSASVRPRTSSETRYTASSSRPAS